MKKGKSRNKRKKTRSRLLWIAIAVIGIAAVISAVCVAGMLATKENAWRTPEELLVEYMDHIPKQEYEEMYAMLHIEASGNVSQEDFVTRNSAIYEGIEVQNMAVQIIAYDEEQMTVTYQTSFDTVAGTISFENEALFLKDEEGYKLVWDDSMIFPNLTSTDKVRVSTTQAERGEILDRKRTCPCKKRYSIFGWNRSGQVGKQRGSNRTDCRTIGNHTGSDRKETVCKVGKG